MIFLLLFAFLKILLLNVLQGTGATCLIRKQAQRFALHEQVSYPGRPHRINEGHSEKRQSVMSGRG